jgi:hypothetical protein
LTCSRPFRSLTDTTAIDRKIRQTTNMPKVKSYSAPWLAKGSPGSRLFESSPDALRSRAFSPGYPTKKKAVPGPRRTIAKRGSEIFVAVGKEIRWADLVYQKDSYASRQQSGRSGTPRIKREDSAMSIVADDESDLPAGVRVCSPRPNHLARTRLTSYRSSKHLLPMRSDN